MEHRLNMPPSGAPACADIIERAREPVLYFPGEGWGEGVPDATPSYGVGYLTIAQRKGGNEGGPT